jgi:DNA-binding MurR/RpiR family transcriptional regulator
LEDRLPVQQVLDGHRVPASAARRRDATSVQRYRDSPQGGRASLLSLTDDRQDIRSVLIRASLDRGHGALTGLGELRAPESRRAVHTTTTKPLSMVSTCIGISCYNARHRFLRDLIVRDIASLQNLFTEISEADLKKAVTLLEKAEVIYLLGQLRSSPVVDLLRYILTMLGKRCVLLDPSGGLATHMARAIRKTDLLFAISFRFYATEVVNIVDEAASRKVPIIAISDSTLSPVAKAASVLLSVPEHEYTFSRSLAAPMCLAQALTVALAARLQKNSVNPRIPTVTEQ